VEEKMESFLHAVNWVEIPAKDFDRAKKFYSGIFDYEMPEMMMGPTRMGILLHNQQEGGIGGALVQGEGYEPSDKGVRVYLNGGADLNTVVQRVEDAGGKVEVPKTMISDQLGHFAIFRDTEGNLLALHSSK
jgi:predicted enzyme related to lactoylglutathione lyase